MQDQTTQLHTRQRAAVKCTADLQLRWLKQEAGATMPLPITTSARVIKGPGFPDTSSMETPGQSGEPRCQQLGGCAGGSTARKRGETA